MTFQFESFAAFLAMNGHGPYVWAAYAVTLFALASLLVQPVLRRRQLAREWQRQQRIQARRNERGERVSGQAKSGEEAGETA